jgi:hypothetical protein
MSEEQPSLQIDTDWKRQAQEEKRKLAEKEKEQQEKARQPAAAPADPAGASMTAAGAPGASAGPRRGGTRELPPASLDTLVQQLLTQALMYLGELAPQGVEPVVNLDMARHQIDIMTLLEQKTQNNLSDDEKRVLDSALYESRMRFVSVASQYL